MIEQGCSRWQGYLYCTLLTAEKVSSFQQGLVQYRTRSYARDARRGELCAESVTYSETVTHRKPVGVSVTDVEGPPNYLAKVITNFQSRD